MSGYEQSNLRSRPLLLNLLQLLLDTSLPLRMSQFLGLEFLGFRVTCFLLCGCERWVCADLLVGLLVHVLQSVRSNVIFEVLGELTFVFLLIIFLKSVHVLQSAIADGLEGYLSNVAAVDVLSQGIGIEGLAILVVSGESVLGVGNVETTIAGSLESTEDSASGRSLSQSNVKEDLEWSSSTVDFLCERVATIGLSDTLVLVCQSNLCQRTTRNQETRGICGSPVLETVLDPVLGQFRGVGGGKDNIALQLGVDDLADLAIRHFTGDYVPRWCW